MNTTKMNIKIIASKIYNVLDDVPGIISLLITLIIILPMVS